MNLKQRCVSVKVVQQKKMLSITSVVPAVTVPILMTSIFDSVRGSMSNRCGRVRF